MRHAVPQLSLETFYVDKLKQQFAQINSLRDELEKSRSVVNVLDDDDSFFMTKLQKREEEMQTLLEESKDRIEDLEATLIQERERALEAEKANERLVAILESVDTFEKSSGADTKGGAGHSGPAPPDAVAEGDDRVCVPRSLWHQPERPSRTATSKPALIFPRATSEGFSLSTSSAGAWTFAPDTSDPHPTRIRPASDL